MVVGARCSNMHSKLHAQLIEPVRRLASEFNKIENRCVGFVQAMLLLCYWPFPFGVSISDTSWMFCGTATHMALQLGLHRPHHQTEYVYRPYQKPDLGPNSTPNGIEISIRRLVWVGCYVVNHRYVQIAVLAACAVLTDQLASVARLGFLPRLLVIMPSLKQ